MSYESVYGRHAFNEMAAADAEREDARQYTQEQRLADAREYAAELDRDDARLPDDRTVLERRQDEIEAGLELDAAEDHAAQFERPEV